MASELVPSPKKPPASRGSRAPDTYAITQQHLDWLEKQPGWQRIDPGYETEKFLDYHRAKGTVFKDWDAAWRNWMRRAIEWSTARQANANRKGLEAITPQAVLSFFEEQ